MQGNITKILTYYNTIHIMSLNIHKSKEGEICKQLIIWLISTSKCILNRVAVLKVFLYITFHPQTDYIHCLYVFGEIHVLKMYRVWLCHFYHF